jgi:glycopeptide antibiotics resistance protein
VIKKFLTVAIIAAVVVTAGGYNNVVSAASQSEGTIPTSGDLCGGTGGNGKITRIDEGTFTIAERNGSSLVVNLRRQATIKASTGQASLSNLKIGDSVTLVGDANRDGTFGADTVVLCGSGTEAESNSAQLKNNAVHYKKVSSNIRIATMLIVGAVWLGLVIFLFSRKKNFVYVLLFTIFYFYLYKVIDYTLLQYQSLLVLKHFVPNLMLNGIQGGRSINLIPLVTLTAGDAKTSLLNILMLMPFGLGLPFITDWRMKRVVIAGMFVSVGIELLQLATGLIGHMTFRVADINDVLFNTLGAMIGYMLFIGFVRTARRVFRDSTRL